jgi:hypothetical protein
MTNESDSLGPRTGVARCRRRLRTGRAVDPHRPNFTDGSNATTVCLDSNRQGSAGFGDASADRSLFLT